MSRLSALVDDLRSSNSTLQQAGWAALVPVTSLVQEIKAEGVDARIDFHPVAIGDSCLCTILQVPAFHDGKATGIARYHLDVWPSTGEILVSTYVPTWEEDPEAYDLGERPEPSWSTDFKIGGDARGVEDLCRLITEGYVMHAVASPGPKP